MSFSSGSGTSSTFVCPMGIPIVLCTIIQNAADKYNVDPNMLLRIWKWESGGSFPNPYVSNAPIGSGSNLHAGGLFGTVQGQDYGTGIPVNVFDTSVQGLQNQANSAALVLSQLISENGGNLTAAMNAYDGGSANETSYVIGGTNPTSTNINGTISGSSLGTYIPVSTSSDIGNALHYLNPETWFNAFTGSLPSDIDKFLKTIFQDWVHIEKVLLLTFTGLVFVSIGAYAIATHTSAKNSTIQVISAPYNASKRYQRNKQREESRKTREQQNVKRAAKASTLKKVAEVA